MSDAEFEDGLEKIIRSLCEYAEKKIFPRLKLIPFNPDTRATYEVIGGLLSRQSTLCRELAKNPNAWTGHLAPLVLRSMADVYITFAWILLDPDKRTQEYIRHSLGQVKLEIEFRKSMLQDADDDYPHSEKKEQIIQALEAWLNSQRFAFLTEVNIGSWSGKSTRTMAEEADCLDFYRFVYEPFSPCVHSTWQHVESYNLEWCSNSLHIPHRIPKEQVDTPDPFNLLLAAKYLDKTLRKFDEVFEFKDESVSVQEFLREKLGSFNQSLKKQPPSKDS